MKVKQGLLSVAPVSPSIIEKNVVQISISECKGIYSAGKLRKLKTGNFFNQMKI